MKKITLLFTFFIAALAIQIAFAAPSLTITKPPVNPVSSWTGPGSPPMPPPGDPHAIYGQWFVDKATGAIYTNRTHEFYDNVDPGWGGGYASCTAIFGYVSALTWSGPGSPITGFDIIATISNDIPALSPWFDGTNSHHEWRTFTSMQDQKTEGPLLDVKLTAEFAVDPAVPFPQGFPTPPYFDPYQGVNIEAVNHDELAWYCWTDDPQAPQPSGDFHVPTWDFGNIAQGASASRTMLFQVPAGIPPTSDPRYDVITNSFFNHTDVLLNRTTSLKISEWIEGIYEDTGVAYPDHPTGGSDVSVFHSIPEPGIFAGISLILLGIYRRMK